MKRLLFLLVLGACGALLFRAFVAEGIYLASDSMAPTLETGDHVFVNKLATRFRRPRRGDIVVFHVPVQPDKDLVKRVIAVGGDVLEIRKKKVIVNGAELNEPYVRYLRPDVIYEGDNIPPIQVPIGYVFVMGDNRDVSGDSRDWKNSAGEWTPYVPLSSIQGVVVLNK